MDHADASDQTWQTLFTALIFTLMFGGLVMVYSASCVRGSVDWVFLQRQALWAAVATSGYFIAARIDWASHLRLFFWLFLLSLILLAAARIPGIGSKVNGAYRWLRFGGYNMQPSEIAKFSTGLMLAAFLAKQPAKLPFFRSFLPSLLLIMLPVGLVLIEPDLGTAALIGASSLAVLLIAGARIWQLFASSLLAAPVGFFFWEHKRDYIIKRIEAWQVGLTNGAGYQIHMSKTALGSGGISGMGLGEGSAKLFYLPEAHTDFIFSIIGQELGLCGTLAVLALFGLLMIAGVKLMMRAANKFAALAIFGIVFTIGLQAAFNIAVVTAAVPPKGISLPFISFGGSGLFAALSFSGVLISVSRHRRVDLTGAAANAANAVKISAFAQKQSA